MTLKNNLRSMNYEAWRVYMMIIKCDNLRRMIMMFWKDHDDLLQFNKFSPSSNHYQNMISSYRLIQKILVFMMIAESDNNLFAQMIAQVNSLVQGIIIPKSNNPEVIGNKAMKVTQNENISKQICKNVGPIMINYFTKEFKKTLENQGNEFKERWISSTSKFQYKEYHQKEQKNNSEISANKSKSEGYSSSLRGTSSNKKEQNVEEEKKSVKSSYKKSEADSKKKQNRFGRKPPQKYKNEENFSASEIVQSGTHSIQMQNLKTQEREEKIKTYEAEIAALTEKLQEKEKSVNSQLEEINKQKNQNATLQTQCQKIRKQKENLNKQNNLLKTDNGTLTKNLEDKKNQLFQLQKNLKKSIKVLEGKNVDLTSQIKENKKNLKEKDDEKAELGKAIKNIQNEKEKLFETNNKLLKGNQELTGNNNQLLLEKQQLTEKNSQLLQERQELTKKNNQLLQERQQLLQERQELTKKNNQLLQDRQQLLQERQQLTGKNSQLLQQKQQLTGKNNQLLQQKQQLAQNCGVLQQEKRGLTLKNTQLMKEKQQLTLNLNGLQIEKQQITAKKNTLQKQKLSLIDQKSASEKKNRELETNLGKIQSLLRGKQNEIQTNKNDLKQLYSKYKLIQAALAAQTKYGDAFRMINKNLLPSLSYYLTRERVKFDINDPELSQRQLLSFFKQSIDQTKFFSDSSIVSRDKVGFLLDQIQTFTKRSVATTKMIHKYDPKNNTSFHQYVDGKETFIVLFKLINNVVLGCFSSDPLLKGNSGYHGFLFNLSLCRSFQVKQSYQGSIMSYDDYYFIFGSSEIRIKPTEMRLYSNFSVSNGIFSSKQTSRQEFLGVASSSDNQIQAVSFEFYKVELE